MQSLTDCSHFKENLTLVQQRIFVNLSFYFIHCSQSWDIIVAPYVLSCQIPAVMKLFSCSSCRPPTSRPPPPHSNVLHMSPTSCHFWSGSCYKKSLICLTDPSSLLGTKVPLRPTGKDGQLSSSSLLPFKVIPSQ